jgi:sulfur-carrier protein
MIKVLLFARAREKAGLSETVWEDTSMTVADVRSRLHELYGIGANDRVMIAVNESYAGDGDTVRGGDVIAVIPPVSGG